MSKLLSFDDAVKIVKNIRGRSANDDNWDNLTDVIALLRWCQASGVEPKRGEWIEAQQKAENGYSEVKGYKCSRCNRFHFWKTYFCPNCGARMEA